MGRRVLSGLWELASRRVSKNLPRQLFLVIPHLFIFTRGRITHSNVDMLFSYSDKISEMYGN